MNNKDNKIKFFRAFALTLTITVCILIAVIGISKAYESTVQIAFGEYKKAFGVTSEGLRILDFEIEFPWKKQAEF